MNKTLFIITEQKYPHLTQDDQVLKSAFGKLQVDVKVVIWNHFKPQLKSHVLIRTPWDYSEHRQDFENFLGLLEEMQCQVFNPLSTLRWNMNKRYLLELQELNIPIVPTHIVDHYSFSDASQFLKFGPIVAKPLVGAGGRDTFLIRDESEIQKSISLLETEVILQPMIESILNEGEYSFLYFGGEFSHALLKKAKKGEFRIQEKHGGTVEHYQPRDFEINEVTASLKKIKYSMTYVRVDMVRIEGKLSIMELEAVEPELFWRLKPQAADEFASLIAKEWTL